VGAVSSAAGLRARYEPSEPSSTKSSNCSDSKPVVYSMEKIVTWQSESRYLPTFLAGDRLLLIVYGDVTAGNRPRGARRRGRAGRRDGDHDDAARTGHLLDAASTTQNSGLFA
jgi:hypothetical protein